MRKSLDPFVEQASAWSNDLIARESRGPGDMPNAMRRLARRYGLHYGTLRSLRYRLPKSITASAFAALRAAYEAECQRQIRKLEHELEITKTIAGPDHAAVRAGMALVRPDSE